MREAIRLGMAEYIPISLAQLPVLIKNGRFPIDTALVQVSAPDRNGYVSLGVSVDISLTAVRYAKRTIAEVNPNMPFTFGDTVIHLSQIDQMVITDLPVVEYTHPPADDVAQQMACYIAGIIEDESTLQIGLGRIPTAALPYLTKRRDLGIHTDVITDSLLDLIESGIVTGHRKSLHPDKIVTSYCMGTKRLYDFIHLNPMFEFETHRLHLRSLHHCQESPNGVDNPGLCHRFVRSNLHGPNRWGLLRRGVHTARLSARRCAVKQRRQAHCMPALYIGRRPTIPYPPTARPGEGVGI